jgi:uncharacterized protein YprB with RNaseH-like and TPR domain
MLPNINQMKKFEIIRLAKGRCRHGHSYLSHYNCYLVEHPEGEKIGFLDIEASNLSADFGIMLCYAIKNADSDKVYCRTITKKELTGSTIDKNVVKSCIDDMRKFTRLITYYGANFDIPYIRTRATIHKLDFPLYGEILHEDLYQVVRRKFRLSRRRLDTAARNLLGASEKTYLDPIKWIRGLQGDTEALKYIEEHCIHDVRELEKLFRALHGFRQRQDQSI